MSSREKWWFAGVCRSMVGRRGSAAGNSWVAKWLSRRKWFGHKGLVGGHGLSQVVSRGNGWVEKEKMAVCSCLDRRGSAG